MLIDTLDLFWRQVPAASLPSAKPKHHPSWAPTFCPCVDFERGQPWASTTFNMHPRFLFSVFFTAQREDRIWQGRHRQCSDKMWPKRSHICSKCTAGMGTASAVSQSFIYLSTLSQKHKAKKSLHLFRLSLQRHIIEQSGQKEHCLDYYYAVRKSIETAFKMWGLANAFVSVLLNRCSY